jgi:beta-N-acetylhexosaminidase
VLLPLILDLEIGADLRTLFESGCCSVLLGETADEYAAGVMSARRMASEAPSAVRALIDSLRLIAGADVNVAVDQEIAGIQRLHGLVPPLPLAADVASLGPEGVEAAAERTARAMRGLGVTWTLAPTLDVVRGVNPWLAKRHIGPDPVFVSAMTSAFIRGMAKGGIMSTAKHFPGCGDATINPHHGEVRIRASRAEYDAVHLPPFRSALAAGVRAVMAGPAIIECIDPNNPVSVSAANLQGLLRGELGFGGLIVSVGLDAPATALGRSVPERSVEALAAGCDLLLVGNPGNAIAAADAIVAAVESGRLTPSRLTEAAGRVRDLATESAAGFS